MVGKITTPILQWYGLHAVSCLQSESNTVSVLLTFNCSQFSEMSDCITHVYDSSASSMIVLHGPKEVSKDLTTMLLWWHIVEFKYACSQVVY